MKFSQDENFKILSYAPLSKFDANIKGTANPVYLITRLVSA